VSLCTALPLWFRPDGPQSPNEVAAQYADYALLLVGYAGTRPKLLQSLKIGEKVEQPHNQRRQSADARR
jgi:hypothetical protein